MMPMSKLHAVLLVVAAAATAPAYAQNSAITLEVGTGSVMVSTGGAFQPAATGTTLVAGEKLMITAGAAATARYPNGAGISFTVPGVYTIAAAGASTPSTVQKEHGAWDPKIAIGVGAAVVVAGALAAGGGGSSNSTPVSAGKR